MLPSRSRTPEQDSVLAEHSRRKQQLAEANHGHVSVGKCFDQKKGKHDSGLKRQLKTAALKPFPALNLADFKTFYGNETRNA